MTEKFSDAERAHYERMKDGAGAWAEFLHPDYGPCDAAGKGGMCTECVAKVQDYRGLEQQVERLGSLLIRSADFIEIMDGIDLHAMVTLPNVTETVAMLRKEALASHEEA